MPESQSEAVAEHRQTAEMSVLAHAPIPAVELAAGAIVTLLPPDWPVPPDFYELVASSPHFAVLQPLAKRRDGSPSFPIAISMDREFYQAQRTIGN